MRGTGTHLAEVVGSGDEAFTKMLLPDAIHDDAGGKCVVAAGDPFGEGNAAAFGRIRYSVPIDWRRWIGGDKHCAEYARRDIGGGRGERTAGEYVHDGHGTVTLCGQ